MAIFASPVVSASAQSPLTDRTGFQVLVSEFGSGGPIGAQVGAEELGGLAEPGDHLFGIDVTGLRRWGSGLTVGVRGAVYRYDPVGLGGRAGLVVGYSRGIGPATVRAELDGAYVQGRFEETDTGYVGAGVEGGLAVLFQARVALIGTVDFRPAAGPYVTLRNLHDVWETDDPDHVPSSFEAFTTQGGVQTGLAVTFALLDARVAIAPVMRFAMVETEDSAAFSALPGSGIWVDF